MKTPFALVVGLSLGAVFGLMRCSPVSMCTPANCLGCCDASGRCAPGTTNTGCGKDGVACVSCAMGQTCSSNVCTVFVTGGGAASTGGGTTGTGGGTTGTGGGTTGTGGGTTGTGGGTTGTGGGTTGTGGGTSGCRSLTMHYEINPARSEYRSVRQNTFMTWEALGGAPLAGTSMITVMEVYVLHPVGQAAPTAPFTGTLPSGSGWRTCRGCIVLSTGCMQGGIGCTATYLATSGNYSVTSATANTGAGSFVGEATNVRLEQWDLANDAKIGTDCYVLPRISWNGTWP